MNLEEVILGAGADTRSIVVSTSAAISATDPFARLVVEHARRGVPVVLSSRSKEGPELGRDLLHALADLPPAVSTLSTAQFMRLAEAGALLETLDFEVLEFPVLTEYLHTLRQHVGDADWPTGIIAIDLRPSNETPGYGPPCESSDMAALRATINITGWTAILGVDGQGYLASEEQRMSEASALASHKSMRTNRWNRCIRWNFSAFQWGVALRHMSSPRGLPTHA